MLKNIDPLLNADLLHVLRAMGHGDELALVDCNFPAISMAMGKPVIRLDGVGTARAGEAILSVLPLDTFVEKPVQRMEMVDRPASEMPAVQLEFEALLKSTNGEGLMGSLERFAFYEAARNAFAIVITGESRGYGCFMLKKGVIFS
ncbi:RbsD/FucU family protein [Motiliproteus sp. MSK22-1]|uniref:RbsD/FucU family protein n=1 Tax=Motiliproteus sp. MSK22-1 TaxID=1897630 RepID=UPI00097668B7|nr:RbsD/FucU domain-containing protein [Motiliproteus sp. MSK22-1]OMH37977.1 fucose-binding protein [Motiliproteus sp. MSK22-1]